MKWILGSCAVLLVIRSSVMLSSAREQACTMSIIESIPENLTYSSASPSYGSTYDGWKSLLKTATKSVDIASFYWSLRGHGNISDSTDKQGTDIFDSLSELSSHGIVLRIVQIPPNQEYPNLDSEALQSMGVATVQNLDIRKLIGSGLLHTKLWVVDSKHFYVGSANMDWRSLTQVKELGLLGLNCESLAQDFQLLFDVYWYLATPGNSLPSPGTWPDKFTALHNSTNPALLSINNSQSASVFLASSPPPFCASGRTNDIDALLQVITTAKSFVFVAVMDYAPAVVFVEHKYYWSRIDDALRAAAYNGVKVRLMGSYWNHTSPDMLHFMASLRADTGTGYRGSIETRLFIVPPLTTKTVPYTRVNHNKYMVTDNTAYVGTSNWSGDYFISTGGVSCTVKSTNKEKHKEKRGSTSIQEQLKQVFERDWYSPYAVNTTSFSLIHRREKELKNY